MSTELQALPGRGIKPLSSLLSHPRLALWVLLLVLLAGAPMVWIKGQSYYVAVATVQVAPRYMRNLHDDGELSFPSNTQYREFLEQQKSSVLRYDIVRDAVRSLGPKARLWRLPNESERLMIDRLREKMTVRVIPDTYMFEISLQAAKKEGLAELVNAVTQVYLARMKVERIYGADVRVQNLAQREQALLSRLSQQTNQRTALALKLGISSFESETIENPYDKVLGELRTSVSEARHKRYEAEARLSAFEQYGETDINTRSIQEAVLIDPGLANLKSNLYKRRADLLVQLSGLTPEHPAHQEMSAEMRRIEQEIAQQVQRLGAEIGGSVRARLQNNVAQTQHIEQELNLELDQQQQQGQQFANLYNQAMMLTHEMEQIRKELESVRERINQFAVENNSFGFVRLVTPALPPEQPFGPGKKKLALMLLLAALGAGLVAPTLRDLMDKRIYTVNDAERILGFPALGWMIEADTVAHQQLADDLLRRLAGSVLHEQQQHQCRVFAFSSVKPGGGSSELVLRLGQCLNRLGYPTLVVEANAFKPEPRMVGAVNEGLCDCLWQQASATQVIQAATADLPPRVSVGQLKGQSHLDQLQQLPALLDLWLQDHRFILVDLPPLLLSADAEMLARQLQQLVLIVEAGGLTKGELARCRRQLDKIAPQAAGVIVNRIRPFSGGGYLREWLIEYLSRHKAGDYFQRGQLTLWLQATRLLFSRRKHHGSTNSRF